MQQSDYMPMSDVLVSAPKRSPQSHFVEEQTGATIFLGKHSDEAIALGCRKAGESLFGSSAFWDQFMPKTYPFTDLWRPVVRPEEICRTLPPDSDILRSVIIEKHVAVLADSLTQILASISNPRLPILPSARHIRTIQCIAF